MCGQEKPGTEPSLQTAAVQSTDRKPLDGKPLSGKRRITGKKAEQDAHSAKNFLPFASVREFLQSFNLATELSSPAERRSKFRELGIGLSDDGFARVEAQVEAKLKSIGDISEEDLHRLYQLAVFNEWMRSNPDSAADYAYQLAMTPSKSEDEKDLQGVELYFSEGVKMENGQMGYGLDRWGISEGQQGPLLFTQLMKRWALMDQGSALAWARSLPDDPLPEIRLSDGRLWLERDYPGMASFQAIALAEVEAASKLRDVLLSEWSDTHPVDAFMAHMSTITPEGISDSKAQTAGELALKFAKADIQSAVAWLDQSAREKSEDGADVGGMYQKFCASAGICSEWSKKDLQAAVVWMADKFNVPDVFMKITTMQDDSIIVLGGFDLARTSPGVFIVQQIFTLWFQQQPDAARAWLKQSQGRSDLTSTQKAFLDSASVKKLMSSEPPLQ